MWSKGLSRVLAATPHCLLSSTIPVLINYLNLALIDSASSGSDMDFTLAPRLKLKIKSDACYITLNMLQLKVYVMNISPNNRMY